MRLDFAKPKLIEAKSKLKYAYNNTLVKSLQASEGKCGSKVL